MRVNVKVKLYLDKIRQLNAAIEPSIQQAVEAVKAQIVSDQVVPKDKGELERSAFMRKKSRTKYQIVYDTPYARKLYWHPEYHFQTGENAKNPNAKGLWMQDYVDGPRKDYFKRAFLARYKANTKGLVK